MPTPAQFTTVTTEGGLLPSDLISRLVNDTRSLPGTREEDYWITPGRQLREIINRSWNDMLGAWQVFQPHVARLSPDDHTATLTWERWLFPLFAELGYGRLDRFPEAIAVGDKDYPVSHHHENALIHLVGWNVRLDRRTAGVAGAAKAAPHSMVQELLNRTDEHLWAILSNGRQLRILRDNSSLTRAAYVEFDLEQMFTEGIFTDFVALWLLVHASRLEGDPQSECWLEQWATEARQLGVRALDTLGQGFEHAIETLGQGFLAHPANNTLRERLRDGHLTEQDYYRQLLRLVYRLVFLLVAEDRALLHPPDASPEAVVRYARFYSLSRVRELARRRRGTKHSDLWDQIAIVVRSLGPEGQPALGLPSLNSGLWAHHGTVDLNRAKLANSYLLAAIRFLAYRQQDEALHRIDYRNLGSEELGSVYESLLELHPDVDQSAGTFSLGHTAGNERKTTGSYYTPTSLISALLDSALEPVLDDAEGQPSPEEALLDLKVLDPACGSGHFLVAAAQRIARRLAVLRTSETDPAPDVFRHALRQVIGRCIFGVDLNPMAVELCKVSLWLESVEPGKPLSFLDHHILCGNSLIGASLKQVEAGIPDDAYKPLTGDERTIVTSQLRRNSAERSGQGALALWGETASDDALARSMAEVDELDDSDLAGIAAKEAKWRSVLDSEVMARARFAADAWCAAFVLPKVPGAVEVTTSSIRRALAQGQNGLESGIVGAVTRAAEQYHFFHFYASFPQVFAGTSGEGSETSHDGFDAVLGNPPWEKVKLAEKEFFASRAPEIAAAAGAARKRMIAALADSDPELYAAYLSALHHAEAESAFLRNSGQYPLAGRGDVNTYAVFAELVRFAMSPSGRSGVIVPSGIATDDTTKHFFGDIVDKQSLVSLFEFENDGFFQDVGQGHMNRFCLLTLTGPQSPATNVDFMFRGSSVTDILDPERRFELTPSDVALVNPNTRTCPVFWGRRDASITLDVYRRVPVMVAKGPPVANPWGIRFMTMFHMTNDSPLFHSQAECQSDGAELIGNVFHLPSGDTWLPLYEGKMIYHFNHRRGDYRLLEPGKRGHVLPEVPPSLLADPTYATLPRYWVSANEVERRLAGKSASSWLLGFRDIADARADSRTLTPCVIPRSAVGNNLPLLLSDLPPSRLALLAASLSSFAMDFLARQKVGGTHLNFFVVEQLPSLPPATYERSTPWDAVRSLAEWIFPRLTELIYTTWDLHGFAEDLGFRGPPFTWDENRRSLLRADLDACFFRLYGIGRDDVEYIMGTFPIVQRKDEAAHGEYRTARLVLECYDAMSKAIETGSPYQGAVE